MKITEADVGRKVVDGHGAQEEIIDWAGGENPVETSQAWYDENGRLSACGPSADDLVRFLDEPEPQGPTPSPTPSPMAMLILGQLIQCDCQDKRTTLVSSLLPEMGFEGLL